MNQPMTTAELGELAHRHLWMCFTRHGGYQSGEDVPIIMRGEGHHIFDANGRKYIDGLAGLFTCQVGHGRTSIGEAAAAQSAQLEFFPLWTYAHPKAVELAARLAGHAPGDLNRVFFTSTGSESVESAWKLAKQYFKLRGQPGKHKVISRYLAYHGTTAGALSLTGIPSIKQPFEPLVPTAAKTANTNFYRAPVEHRDDLEQFGRWAADQLEATILMEGPESVAAFFLEPVQNTGGCFPPPPGYLQRVREICTKYDVLMVADETITGFGRIGEIFAVNRYGVVPDIITCAKGLTSGYVPMGAVIASDRIFEAFNHDTTAFLHGFTYSGHPVAAAAALANLDIIEAEDLCGHVRRNEAAFLASLETLRDIPIVGDVRGAGYFYGIELVKDQATRETFSDEESERLLRGIISPALFEGGLYCRADDRGEPVIQLSPPLTIGPAEFDEMTAILRNALELAVKEMA